VTGTERYTREVVQRLAEVAPDLDWRFYAARPAPGLGVDLTVLPFPRLWTQARLPAELARRPPDLFLDLAHVVPTLCPAPSLKVFHDLAFERFPGAYRPADLAYLRWTARRAARVCRTMIAVSEATRQDLVSLYGVDPDRVTVVHEGGGETAPPARDPEADAVQLRRFGIDAPYVLSVGRVEPRKNQLAALEAVERLPGLLLVCAGAIHDEAMAARLDASPRCRLLGRVSDAERDLL
jgi:glycosyltransferase involved in cell wall biosynthesis